MPTLSALVFLCIFCNYHVSAKSSRIVGGSATIITEVPYQLSLERKQPTDQSYHHICGAVIIDERWALTAAHCLVGEGNRYRIRAGHSYIEKGDIYNIKTIVVHPKYNDATDDYDIAMLKTTKPFVFSDTAQPIPLATRSPSGGTLATVSGWGSDKRGGNSSPKLQKVEVKIISAERCCKLHRKAVTVRMLCAGLIKGGKDSCGGDSGGPLAAKGKLIGIVSWGFGCGVKRKPGVYTRVAKFVGWIKETQNSNEY